MSVLQNKLGLKKRIPAVREAIFFLGLLQTHSEQSPYLCFPPMNLSTFKSLLQFVLPLILSLVKNPFQLLSYPMIYIS